MNPFPARKSIPAVLATLAFLAGWHLMFKEPGRPWGKVVAPLVVVILGELVREWVVAHTPASDDESVIERRRMLARAAAGGFIAATATFAAFAYWGVVHRMSPMGYASMLLLLIVLVCCGAVAMGLTLNDKVRQAEKAPPEAKAFAGAMMKVILLVASLILLGGVAMDGYESWVATGHLPAVARFKLVAAVVATLAFNAMAWRQIAQSTRTAEDTSDG